MRKCELPKVGEPAFCEATTAGGGSPWHIRFLGPAGLKPSGGVDTCSLCGHVTPEKGGWDIPVRFSETHPNACKKCLDSLKDRSA